MILASEEQWNGVTPPLTASKALTMAEVAAIASDALGKEVRHTIVSDAKWRDRKIKGGMPPLYADMLLGTFKAARRGDFAATDHTLAKLLGRPAQAMHDVIAATNPGEGGHLIGLSANTAKLRHGMS